MYTFYVLKLNNHYVLSFCNCKTLEINNFEIVPDKSKDYDKLHKFISSNIYSFKDKAQKELLVGWNNSDSYNAILNNCIYEQSLMYHANIEKNNNPLYFYIADLYAILNIKSKLSYDPQTALRYTLLVNDIACINNSYNTIKEMTDICNEYVTGLAILTNIHKKEIEFSYSYSKYYNSKNVIMSPLRAAIKKITSSIFKPKEIQNIFKNSKYINKIYGSELDLVDIEIKDKTLVNKIRQYTFGIGGENKEIYNYTISNAVIKCTKVGITFSKNVYIDDSENNIYYIDIKSFFPSILIKHKFIPQNFIKYKDNFLSYINKILELKTSTNEQVYKDILTGIVGLMAKEGILHDLKCFYNITINGILYMINLLEYICERFPQMNILNAKIDGFIITINNRNDELFHSIVNEWSKNNEMNIKIQKIKKIFIKGSNDKILVAYSNNTYEHNYNFIKENFKDFYYTLLKGYNDGENNYDIIAHGIFNYTNKTINTPQIVKLALFFNFVFDISATNIIMNGNNIFLYSINNYNSNSNYKCVYLENDSIKEKDIKTDMIKYFVSLDKHDCILKSGNSILNENNCSVKFDGNPLNKIKYQWYIKTANEYLSTMSNLLFD